MKLSSLFAKYLYQYKILRLPGIGVFTLDPSVTIPDAADKTSPDITTSIKYSQETVKSPDEDFINFIRTETGKIKPLAESDLDSFLTDGKILLNIGKPFQIEGIGYLQKTREGVLEFKSGEPLHRMETHKHETEEPVAKQKTFYLDTTGTGTSSRKILIALGAIAGIVIVIWGGYILYNKNSSSGNTTSDSVTTLPVRTDTSGISAMPDSFRRNTDSSSGHIAGTYKFVIERTANKGRALRRYNQLVGNFAAVKMESQDSTLFKLYFLLPATPADTARIRDSLKTWYGRKVVYVE